MGKGGRKSARSTSAFTAAEKRAEAERVKADPHWVRSLARSSQVVTSSLHVYASRDSDGSDKFSSDDHDLMTREDFMSHLSGENLELLNRPGRGLSMLASSLRASSQEMSSHASEASTLLNANALKPMLDMFLEVVPALETLDLHVEGVDRQPQVLENSLKTLTDLAWKLNQDRHALAVLSHLKYLGPRLYLLGAYGEILTGLLGNPVLFRQKIANVANQDASIRDWEVKRNKDDSTWDDFKHMQSFLSKSLQRTMTADEERLKTKPAGVKRGRAAASLDAVGTGDEDAGPSYEASRESSKWGWWGTDDAASSHTAPWASGKWTDHKDDVQKNTWEPRGDWKDGWSRQAPWDSSKWTEETGAKPDDGTALKESSNWGWRGTDDATSSHKAPWESGKWTDHKDDWHNKTWEQSGDCKDEWSSQAPWDSSKRTEATVAKPEDVTAPTGAAGVPDESHHQAEAAANPNLAQHTPEDVTAPTGAASVTDESHQQAEAAAKPNLAQHTYFSDSD